jgi:hypothetical protein
MDRQSLRRAIRQPVRFEKVLHQLPVDVAARAEVDR